MKTVSEQLFERICQEKGVPCNSIQCGRERTPDYTVLLAGVEVIVEIKELESNEQDTARRERVFTEKQVIAFFPSAKIRVREKIKSASKQLKNMAAGKHPSILVLFDNTGGFAGVEANNILTAMYGNEVWDIGITDPDEQPGIINARFGGDRQMTPDTRRYISAIGLIRFTVNNTPELDLYHNIFADLPLDPRLGARIATKQYSLPAGNTDMFYEWEEIELLDEQS